MFGFDQPARPVVMARYKVILAYDGSAFKGLQRQRGAKTVQGTVESTLRKLGWQGKSVLAAGRTDAGVHATGQVIAFDMEWAHSEQDLLQALNATLPAELAAQRVSLAADDFHPRYDAKARRYEYRVFCQPLRHPIRERTAWRVWPAPKLRKLQAAARQLEGPHDFAAFGSPPKAGGTTQRTVFRARWRRSGEDEFHFEVSANAFLYHMVRRMVGLLVRVGQGQLEAQAVARALHGELVQELAPAEGLCLIGVDYVE